MAIAIIAEIGMRSRMIRPKSLDAVRNTTVIISVAVAVPLVVVPTAVVPTVVVRPRRSQRDGTNA